jgi:hypothetical protein
MLHKKPAGNDELRVLGTDQIYFYIIIFHENQQASIIRMVNWGRRPLSPPEFEDAKPNRCNFYLSSYWDL